MVIIPFAAATIAIGIWVGSIIFQSLIVAPVVFSALDEKGARGVLRGVFPRFFRLGIGCSGFALLALLAAGLLAGWSGLVAPLVAAAVMTLLACIALYLVPAINAARDAGDAGAARFRRLHSLSVALTVASLVVGIGLLGAVGAAAAGS
jgi:Ca2+/Na+ antiporter